MIYLGIKKQQRKCFIYKSQQSIMDWRILHGPSRLLRDNMKDLVSIFQLIFFAIHIIFALKHFLLAWAALHSVVLYLVLLLSWQKVAKSTISCFKFYIIPMMSCLQQKLYLNKFSSKKFQGTIIKVWGRFLYTLLLC